MTVDFSKMFTTISITDQIKFDLQEARVSRNTFKAKFLAVLVGEIQLIESRDNKILTDDGVTAIIKKFRKNAEQMLQCGSIDAQYEIDTLNEYLNDELTWQDVVNMVKQDEPLFDDIVGASNAMRYIRDVITLTGADGGVAKEAVLFINGK
jgi:uncharacterized protein YqeY